MGLKSAPMVAIVDCGMGNLLSVRHSFATVGARTVVTSDPDTIARAERVVLPGVGAFPEFMRELERRNLTEAIRLQRRRGVAILGICLGMQVLASAGDEAGGHDGLGWIPGRVRLLGRGPEASLPLPHVGWSDVDVDPRAAHFFAGLGPRPTFYFVHSYAMHPRDAGVVAATCSYGEPFCAAVLHENVFAVQFHPEKSQHNGYSLLDKFLAWSP